MVLQLQELDEKYKIALEQGWLVTVWRLVFILHGLLEAMG